MIKKLLLTTGLTLSVFAFAGMGHGSKGATHNMAPMKNLTSSTVVAEVNGNKITVKDVNAYMQGMTKDFRIRLQDLPAQHVKEFVEKYVETEKYYAKAKPITKTPQYKALMKKIAVDLWMAQEYKKIKISDKEVKAFYDKNKELYYKTTPKLKARHIVVKDKKLAEKLISELKGLKGKALEKKFAELAKKYSIGPSKIDGGELGFFNVKDMVKEFSDAALKLKKGEITSKPVQTRFGYHIILLEDKDTNNFIPYKELKGQIHAYLTSQALDNELTNIDKSSNVKILVK